MNLRPLESLILGSCAILAAFASNGISPPQLLAQDVATTVAALDQYIEETRQEWQVPGLAVAIVQGDQVLLSKGYGVLEQGSVKPVDQHSLFAIASNSKAFTAAGLAMLVDDGKLRWDDPVHKYLPWLQLSDPLASSELRVRDLLCHRSGLGTFSGDLLWWGTPYSPRQVLERAVFLPPASSFRAEYGYSNLMYLAAGQVIEVVADKPWGQFVEERILQPLDMRRTVTSVRDLVSRGNFATPHKTLADQSAPIAWMNWDTMASAGGIISSADDMSQWLRLQLRKGSLAGDKRIFSEQASHEMWQAQMAIPVSRGSSGRTPSTHFRAYGLGWSLSDYNGRKLVGHGGGYDGMYSQVLMVPEENLGVVVLTNSMTSIGSAITYEVVDRFLGLPDRDWSGEQLQSFQKSRVEFGKRVATAISPAAQNTSPSHPLSDYVSTFECPMYGRATVELVDGHLVLKLLPYPDLVADLEHLHYDTFVIRWRKQFAWFDEGTAHFVCDAKGRFAKLELDVPNDDLWFYELNLKRVD